MKVATYVELKEAVTRELARISEGTDASTTDGKSYRGRFASSEMMAVYRATEAALDQANGVITVDVLNAAEEAGMSNGCDPDELYNLTEWLEENQGKTMETLSAGNYVPSWARGGKGPAGRAQKARAAKADKPIPGRFKYFSV